MPKSKKKKLSDREKFNMILAEYKNFDNKMRKIENKVLALEKKIKSKQDLT